MPAIQTKRWTRVEYERLIDLGVFGPGDRLELLGGQLVVAEPQGTDHYSAILRATRVLQSPPSERAGWSGPRAPSRSTTNPSPSRTWRWCRATSMTIGSRTATRPVLAIEVTVSSLALDRSHKASLYARAGVADTGSSIWSDRVLEVHRDPAPDLEAPYGWAYASVEIRKRRRLDRARRRARVSDHSSRPWSPEGIPRGDRLVLDHRRLSTRAWPRPSPTAGAILSHVTTRSLIDTREGRMVAGAGQLAREESPGSAGQGAG